MRSFTLVVGGIFVLAALGPALGQSIDGKTPKGIAYRYERMTTGENVAVYFAWRYALNDETKDLSLINYVVPGLTFGAGGESKDTIDRKLRELGATFGTYSPLERTVGGYLTFERPKTDQVAPLLAQIVQKPNYTAKDLDDRHKKVLVPLREKFNREPLNQVQFVQFALNLPAFADRSRWAPRTEASIKPPPREKLLEWHKRTLGRNNLVVSVAGNLSEGDAGSFVDRVFGALPVVTEPEPLSEPTYRALDKIIKIERNVPQVYVRLYGAVDRDNDPIKTAALQVALAAFGNGRDSTLHKTLREELGAAYSTSAGALTISPRMNLMAATVQIDPEKAAVAIDRLREEYRKLLENGIDEATVKHEIDRVIAPPNLQPARAPVRASVNLVLAMRGLPVDTRVQLRKAYNSILTEQINALIMEHMPKAVTIVAMAPASVAIKADCTIKSYSDTAKCGF
jgi:predicted Zn-dependent peptidase